MGLPATNRVQLAYIPESSFGVVPTTGNGYNLRTTGETLNYNMTKEQDKELNSAAELSSSTTTYAEVAGDIKVHMQYAEYDRFLASLLRSAWSAYGTNGVGTTFSASVTAGTMGTTASVITAGAAPTGSSAFTTLAPGQWFKISMPGDPNDGKVVRNSTSVAATSTTITLDVNTPLAASTSVAGSSISTSRLKNGTTLQSFTIERQVPEANQYFTYRGQYISKFSADFASKAISDASFTLLGKDVLAPTGTTNLPGATAASNTYDIQNGVTGVGNIWEAGVPLSGVTVKKASFNIDSGLRAQDGLGVLGLAGVGIGTFVVTGTLDIYFANGALFAKYMNDTYTALSLMTKDTSGNGYVLSLPKIMLTKATVTAGSKDADLMASFEFTAYSDKANANAALRATMFIDRFGAAVAP